MKTSWPKLLLGIGAAMSPLFALAWATSRRRGLAGPAEDRRIARKSYDEEMTAIRAYGSRYRRAEDPRLKKAIAHARREEITHAASFKPLRGLLPGGELSLGAAKISSKDPAVMTASEINKEMDKLDKIDSEITERFIEAGRGHERPSEIRHMTDPLAVEHNAIADRRRDLRIEIDRRYGPGAPSRFPTSDPKYRGYFKPRKKADDLGAARDALPAPVLKKWKRAISDYKRALTEIEAGDADARQDAQRARERMRKLRDEAAAHVPGSYNDPALHDLDAEESALPKISDAEERGREARYKAGQSEIKKLREEEREVNRETNWMRTK